MSTTLRVATLETALTVNDEGLVTGLTKAKQATDAVDGTKAAVDVTADPAAAVADLAKVADKADKLDGTKSRVELVADAAQALSDLQKLADEAKDLDRTRTDVEILADTKDAKARLDEAAAQIKKIDGETATVTVDVDETGAEKGFGRAGENVAEFKSEALQNFSEVTSSFSGDMQSIGDLAQGTLGGLASSISGPLGIALGAAAVGVGALVKHFSDAAAAAEQVVTDTADLANQIVDAGGALDKADYAGKFRDWAAQIANSANWFERLTGMQKESTTNLDELKKSADEAGVSVDQLVTVMSSGDVVQGNDLLEQYGKKLGDVTDQIAANQAVMVQHVASYTEAGPIYDEAGQAAYEMVLKLEKQKGALEDTTGKLKAQVTEQETAQRKADELAAAADGVSVAQLKMQRAVDKANQSLQDQGDKNRSVAQSNLDLQQQIEDTTTAMTETDDKTKKLTHTETERKQSLLDLAGQIVETASAQSDASGKTEDYNKVIAANRDAFIKAAAQMGITGQAAQDLADQYGLIPKQVSTKATADTQGAMTNLDNLYTKVKQLPDGSFTVTADTSTASQKLSALATQLFNLNSSTGVLKPGFYVQKQAEGGVLTAFANGSENHVAQIAQAGDYRLWAEEETGGEAYIPLAASKRARSMAILEDVAGRFGAQIVKRANGAVDGAPGASPVSANLAPSFDAGAAAIVGRLDRLERALMVHAEQVASGVQAVRDRDASNSRASRGMSW